MSLGATTLRRLAVFAVPLLLRCTPANVGVSADADTLPEGSPGADAAPDAGAADATSDAGGDASIAAACQDFAYAYCNRLKTCSSTLFQERYGTESTCESIQRTTCTISNTTPSTTQTPTSTEACVAELGSWTCTDFIYTQNRPPACLSEATGTRPNGASCAISTQCQSTYCALPSDQACGTCAPAEPGAPCETEACPSGLACVAGTCVAYVDQGAACSASQPCNEGLTCAPGTAPGSMICQPGETTQGAPCSFTGAGCDVFSGLACNAQTGVCEVMQLVQPGQACGLVANQIANCIAGSCPRGQCLAYIPAGGACDLDGEVSCLPPTRCLVSGDGATTGTCTYNGSTACP